MKLILALMLVTLVSCSSQKIEDYKDANPKLSLRSFFNGKLLAQGIVQDRSGVIINRFDVDINAYWKENVGTIDEKFQYSDNTKSTRVWKLTEIANSKYEGVAHDVIGVAKGEVAGNAFYFEYVLDVPVGKKSYNIHFDDWMYLLDENTLMAKTAMTKWGFKVGEVTIVMKKVK